MLLRCVLALAAALACGAAFAQQGVVRPPLGLLEGQAAQSSAPKPEPKRVKCIKTDRIREAQVQDDRTVNFRMRGGDIVQMKLANACMGLAFHESFYYTPSPDRELCERIDVIVARSGSRCMISSFTQIEDGKDKKKKKKKERDERDGDDD